MGTKLNKKFLEISKDTKNFSYKKLFTAWNINKKKLCVIITNPDEGMNYLSPNDHFSFAAENFLLP